MLGLNLFNKNHPEFWKKYSESFKLNASKYVVISLESSGTNPEKDVIMGIALTSVLENKIIINESIEFYISHKDTTQFDSEFVQLSKHSYLKEYEAIEVLINFISNSVIIGHKINFDLEIINETLNRFKLGKLKNDAFDIEAMTNKLFETNDKNYALDEICSKLDVPVSDHNSIADECFQIAMCFLKLKDKLGIK